jgi:CheY-like chemotaxis protein
VKIYSEVGQGTAVKIYLPRLTREATESSVISDQLSPDAALEETVLVLEDDDDVRTYSAEILRELGYRVLEAHDGPAALRVLDQYARVDLLFTDVVLPGGMTGAQVAAHARALRSKLKVFSQLATPAMLLFIMADWTKVFSCSPSRSPSAISPPRSGMFWKIEQIDLPSAFSASGDHRTLVFTSCSIPCPNVFGLTLASITQQTALLGFKIAKVSFHLGAPDRRSRAWIIAACSPSAPLRQIEGLHERRISGSS